MGHNITVGDLGQMLAEEISKHLTKSEIVHELLLTEIRELREHVWNLENVRDENDETICSLAERCMELERELSRTKCNHRAAGVVIKSLRQKLECRCC